MKARDQLIVAARAISAVVLFYVLLHEIKPDPLHLVMVRRVRERGRSGAFFRVEGAGHRMIQIVGVTVLAGGPAGVEREKPTFGLRGWPCGDPHKARQEFDVLTPPNAAIWEVRTSVQMSSSLPRVELDLVEEALRECWNNKTLGPLWHGLPWPSRGTFYAGPYVTVESGPVIEFNALNRSSISRLGWEARSLPVTRTNGDLALTLTALAVGARADQIRPGHAARNDVLVFRSDLCPAARAPAFQTQPGEIRLHFSCRNVGTEKSAGGWRLREAYFWDSLGHHGGGLLASPLVLRRGGFVATFPATGGLDLRARSWRVRLGFVATDAQASRMDAIWHVRLPASFFRKRTGRAIPRHFQSGELRVNAWNLDGVRSAWALSTKPGGGDRSLSLLRARIDGVPVTATPIRSGWPMGLLARQGLIGGLCFQSFKVPRDAKTVKLTVAVRPTRYLTFVVRPSALSAPRAATRNSASGLSAAGFGFSAAARLAARLLAPYGYRWVRRNPLSTTNCLFGLTFGDGRFVAVGDSGTILTSPRGLSWTWRASGVGKSLKGVAYGGHRFVAVGRAGAVASSPDGVSWTPGCSGTAKDLMAIAYGQGRFVAVGRDGTLLTSLDGQTWTHRPTGLQSDLWDVGYGGGRFAVVGRSNMILVSHDGLNWNRCASGADKWLSGIAYGGGRFVAVGDWGQRATCPDGGTWKPLTVGTRALSRITFGDHRFVAVGTAGLIATSKDGREWKDRVPLGYVDLHGVAYGNHRWIAVGERETGMISSNAFMWSRISSRPAESLVGITFGKRRFVAVGPEGALLSSSNAVRWVRRPLGVGDQLNGVAYGNHRFVGVGSRGAVYTSFNGLSWTRHSFYPQSVQQTNRVQQQPFLNGIEYGKGRFVAVGSLRGKGAIATSPDGDVWTDQASRMVAFRLHDPLLAVIYGKDRFVAVGESGSVLTSPNGLTWSKRNSGTDQNLRGIAYGRGRFVVVGDQGCIVTSPDGVVWTRQVSGTVNELLGIAHDGNRFVAVGGGGTILTSLDGIRWTDQASPTYTTLTGIAYGNHQFVVVGGADTILSLRDSVPVKSRSGWPEPASQRVGPKGAASLAPSGQGN